MSDRLQLFLRPHQGAPHVNQWGAGDAGAHKLEHHPGLRGWLGRKAEHFKTRWHESRTGLTGKMHQVWDWLHERTPLDDPLLVGLRKAHRIEVFHPDSLSAEEARGLWDLYLIQRRRRHLPRLAINMAITPLTVLLIPLPGPNVVGFWFAYRSIHHLLIVHGLGKASKQKIDVSFHPINDDEAHRRMGERADLDRSEGFGDHLATSSEPPADSLAGVPEPAHADSQPGS
jgi:hypothetical protein